MSIKPVDMQVLLPRSQEIQRGEMIKDSKSQNSSHFVLTEDKKETVRKTSQVKETQKGDGSNVKLKDENHEKKGQSQTASKGFTKETERKDKQDLITDRDIDLSSKTLGKNIDIKI